MAEKNGIYKCSVCGNLVSVVDAKGGTLVCCEKKMNLLAEKSEDEGKEKHVPVINIEGHKVTVKVGSIPHPMEEDHYIQLIQVLGDGKVIASYQPSPGEKPEAEFQLDNTERISARAVCNTHGLWKS